jgi:hypothetical protein
MPAWKRTEQRVAETLGAKHTAMRGKHVPDARSDWLVIEVKHREHLPEWILAALKQAQNFAQETQLPIAVLHEKGGRIKNSLVVMTLQDFHDWFGGIEHDTE